MKKKLNKNYIIAFTVGLMVSSIGVYAVNSLSSSEISYDNVSSGIEADTMQGAIDKLYERTKSYKEYIPNDNPNRNIIKAYVYDEDQNSQTYCITGKEEKCFPTTCYDNKSKNSCKPGTIIVYKVNQDNEVKFHVLRDEGSTMMLQSQENIVHNTVWYLGNPQDNSQGPLTVLSELENAVENWTNVNPFDYSIGDDHSTLGYSSCYIDSCKKGYTLKRTNAKARMITVQEAIELGCKSNESLTCPIWMSNFLYNSTEYNGTDSDTDLGYWAMSAYPASTFQAIQITVWRYIDIHDLTVDRRGARAVVEISK